MITVAWVTRNDDHGGMLIPRMKAAAEALAEYRRAGVDIELVIVEWNPPTKKVPLGMVFKVPESLPYKWYIVPPTLHQRFDNWERFGLWNHIGTNVGLRRGSGEWVLATTHDIVFSHQLAQLLAEEDFDSSCFYRAPRYDGEATYEDGLPVAELISSMESHGVKRNDYKGVGFFTKSCGDFILMHRDRWNMIRGYIEWPINGIWLDGLLMHMAHGYGGKQVVFDAPVYHMNHEGRGLEIYKGLPHMPRDAYKAVCAGILERKEIPLINVPEWGLKGVKEVQVAPHKWIISDDYKAPELRKLW